MPKLIGIAIKKAHRAPMETLESAVVSVDTGVTGDYRGARTGSRKRQVTILSDVQWMEAHLKAGYVSVPWTTRRANLLIEWCAFSPSDVGKKIHIGEDVVLEITGETTPCDRMDEAYPGLKDALDSIWRGGVTCRVIKGGDIKLGDDICIE